MTTRDPRIMTLNNYPADLGDVARVEADARGQPGTVDRLLWSKLDYQDHLSSVKGRSPGGASVAKLNGRAMGVLCFHPRPRQNAVEICHLLVHPSVRRRGVGTLLVKGLIEASAKRGKGVYCVVPERSHEVVHFFLSCGFRGVTLWRQHFGEDEDGYYMQAG